jgi:GPH family glycoside/pentoside/hexuronide:cation symporter
VASHQPLSRSVKLAYGAPAFAGAAMVVTVGVHATRFYSDVVLAPLGTVALMTAVARAFDAITDPFMGWLSDRTRSRWGRRLPYIAAGTVPAAITFWLFLSPPVSLGGPGSAVWFGVVFCVMFLFSTITSIPSLALGAELSLEYHERSSLFGIRSVFAAAGTIVGATMPGILESGLGIHDERAIFSGLAAAYGVALVVLNGVLLRYVRERPEFARRESNPFIPGVRRALRNRPFRILLLAGVVNAVPAAIPAILIPYFVYYAIRPDQPAAWLAIFLLAYLGAGFVFLPMWMVVARRWGKLRTMVAASVMGISGSTLFFFAGPGDTRFALAVYLYTGVASGALLFILPAMGADTIDYDELRTGKRREAQFGAFWGMIPKFVSIPGGSIPIAILSAVGYVPNQVQTAEVIFTIKFLYAIFPAAFYVGALAIVMRYPISEEVHRAIRAGIEAHGRGEPARDPLTGERIAPAHEVGAGAAEGWFLDHFSPRELERVARHGPRGLVTDVVRSIVLAALAVGMAVTVVVATLGGGGAEPGPTAVLAVVAAGGAFTALCFHLARLGAARRFVRAPVPRARVMAHLVALRAAGGRVDSLRLL